MLADVLTESWSGQGRNVVQMHIGLCKDEVDIFVSRGSGRVTMRVTRAGSFRESVTPS
jgi:hypothetical protein